MKTSAIADGMMALGFQHDNPPKMKIALYTALSRRDDVFEKLGEGMWRLKEQTA